MRALLSVLVLTFAIFTFTAVTPSCAQGTASAQTDSEEEEDLNLLNYGYTVPSGHGFTAVTGVPAAAASGFRGQGYGAACVRPPPATQCHPDEED